MSQDKTTLDKIHTTLTFISLWLFFIMLGSCSSKYVVIRNPVEIKPYKEPAPWVAPKWMTELNLECKRIIMGEEL